MTPHDLRFELERLLKEPSLENLEQFAEYSAVHADAIALLTHAQAEWYIQRMGYQDAVAALGGTAEVTKQRPTRSDPMH